MKIIIDYCYCYWFLHDKMHYHLYIMARQWILVASPVTSKHNVDMSIKLDILFLLFFEIILNY